MVSATAFTGTGRHRAPYWTLRHIGQAGILTGLAVAIPAAFLYSSGGRTAPPLAPPAPQAVVSTGAVARPVNIHQFRVQTVQVQATYTVRAHDSLSKIAKAQLGSAKLWPELWWLNRHRVHNPMIITAGLSLRLAPLPPARERYARAAIAAIPPPPKPAAPTGQAATGAAVVNPPAAAAPVGQTASVPTSSGIYSYSALEALWVSAGGPASAEAQAAQIAICESGGNPSAYNPSGATGLWQILGSVVPGNLDNPSVNAANAVAKFNASGGTFAQWVCQ